MDANESVDLTLTTIAIQGVELSPRSTPAAATIGTVIYVFGGGWDDYRAETVIAYNDLYAFDTETNILSRCEPTGTVPSPRFFAAGAADESTGQFYVFGGSSYDHGFANLATYGELYCFSAGENSWHLAAGPDEGPGPRVRPNLWSFDGGIYAFGGLDANMRNHNDLWRFDTARRGWDQIAGDTPAVVPRYEAVSGNTSATGMVYALGGEVMGEGFRPKVIPGSIEIDLTSGHIRPYDLREGGDVTGGVRHQGAAAEIAGRLYVYGGDDPRNKVMGCGAPYGQAPVGETWVLDSTDRTWRLAALRGPKLKRTVASAAGGKMYVFGGYDFECENDVGRGQVWNTDVVRIEPSG